MNLLRRLRFWFENRQGYMKLSRYRTENREFYSVLMYHGVENDKRKRGFRPYDLSERAIKSEIDFYQKQGYQLCSYVDVADEKHAPNANLMLTFDDGHHNIAQTVSDLARHYQIRPVIAICPGVVDSQSPFWFEEIYARVCLSKQKDIHPSVSPDDDPYTIYRQIMDFYLADPSLKSNQLLATIRQATDDVDSEQVLAHPAVHRNLGWNELCSLVDQNLCTIAIHTLYHDSVSHMDADEFEADIDECKRLIQRNLSVDSSHFVYPFGRDAHDWESDVLSKFGITYSYVVDEKINSQPQDNYKIKRITGRDFTKEPGYYRYLWHQRHAELITLK